MDWGDFDNDDDLDILLAGWATEGVITRVYRNNGDSTFTQLPGLDLPGMVPCTVSWADTDNDGDLDILLSGTTDGGPLTVIHRNDGGGAFTPLHDTGIPSLGTPATAWGDYDGDGDLDIAFCGSQNPTSVYSNRGDNTFALLPGLSLSVTDQGAIGCTDYDNDGRLDFAIAGDTDTNLLCRIVHNDGGGAFTERTDLDLPGFLSPSMAWGDFNNNGRKDLIVAGVTNYFYRATRLYWNNSPDFQAASAETNIPDVSACSLAAGDFNNDGRLDLLVTGHDGTDPIAKILENGCATTNTPPTPPSGLSAVFTNGLVTISWLPASDNETPASGLSYNLRIGSVAGGGDMMSGMANGTNGFRRIARAGAIQGTNWTWRPAGASSAISYHITVQAVDSALAGSPFSAETTVSVVGAPATVSAGKGALPDRIPLTWQDVGADSYEVWRAATNDLAAAVHLSSGADPTSNSYADTSGILGAEYRYWIRAVHAGSQSAFSVSDTGWLKMFEEYPAVLSPFVDCHSADWSDFDNDGWLDILVTGNTATGYVAEIWHNNGDRTFTPCGNANILTNGLNGLSSFCLADANGDGLIDVLIGRYSIAETRETTVCLNTGTNTFRPIAINDGLFQKSIGWADIDNDGDPDVTISGYSSVPVSTASLIHRNDGNEIFTERPGLSLTGRARGSIAWGDYDGDARLDLLLYGYLDPGNSSTVLYRNNGDGSFASNTVPGLADVDQPDVAWQDFNHDGRLDIVAVHKLDSGCVLRVFTNAGAGFVEMPVTDLGISGYSLSHAEWGDFDSDGDLDLFISSGYTGFIHRREADGSFTRLPGSMIPASSYLTRNAWGDFDNDGAPDLLLFNGNGVRVFRNLTPATNTQPSAPGPLSASYADGIATIAWTPSTDAETPATMLTYNIRIGSTPGACDIASPLADATTGRRRVPLAGSIQGTNWVFYGTGVYYIAVQAIDSGMAGSLFATECSFSFPDDFDGDRLGHNDELAHGTDPHLPDTDGDGMLDGWEVLADTDPLSTNSFLGITNLVFIGGIPRIEWHGGASVTQYIDRATALSTNTQWTAILTTEPPTSIEGEFTDPNPPETSAFYRIRIGR